MATWQISGEYMETCNCTMLCPCITSNLAATPTEGDCPEYREFLRCRTAGRQTH